MTGPKRNTFNAAKGELLELARNQVRVYFEYFQL